MLPPPAPPPPQACTVIKVTPGGQVQVVLPAEVNVVDKLSITNDCVFEAVLTPVVVTPTVAVVPE